MISILSGEIINKGLNYVDLLTQSGIGFKVFVPVRELDKLKLNASSVLLVHHYLRENREDLFGFIAKKDKEFFEKLIAINGVGPIMAIDILSQFSTDEFVSIVQAKDVSKICTVSGVGKKTASRIILELAEKLVTDGSESGFSKEAIDKLSEVKAALKALSFSEKEQEKMVKALKEEEILEFAPEKLVLMCLKNNG